MGFTIFTSSGTFTPSDYGLKAGDCIHIICVGGGGSGSGGNSAIAGKAGVASSFGSVVSSAGGSGGIQNGVPTAQVGSSQPSFPGMCYLPDGTSQYACYYGGSGGHGWHPQLVTPPMAGSTMSFVQTRILGISSSSISMAPTVGSQNSFVDVAGNRSPLVLNNTTVGQSAAQTGLFGGYGGCYYNSGHVYLLGGAGGVGYGAGGGGCGSASYCGGGGNGGVITHKDYVLTSTSGIAITVGAGGAAPNNYNGGGARGCVAIFW